MDPNSCEHEPNNNDVLFIIIQQGVLTEQSGWSTGHLECAKISMIARLTQHKKYYSAISMVTLMTGASLLLLCVECMRVTVVTTVKCKYHLFAAAEEESSEKTRSWREGRKRGQRREIL